MPEQPVERRPRGGHFAALEQPEALANEVREFFRPLRRR
jgi:pimeloyl-ACP methyl ester carboxylesterase